MNRIRCLTGILALAAACSIQRTPPPADTGGTAETRAAVVEAMDHYAALVQRVGSDSLAALFAADAELLEPGMAVLQGREAIRAFLAPFDGTVKVDTVATRTDHLDIHGTNAYLWGRYHQVATLRGQPPSAFDGRFVAQWRLEGDARWRIVRLLMQPAPAWFGTDSAGRRS